MARTKKWLVPLVALLVAAGTRVMTAQSTGPTTLDWQPTHLDAIRVAGQTNRLVLVHFYSPSCQACQTIERDVYSQPSVQQQIHAKFVPFKVNVEVYPATATTQGITGTPMDLILDSSGKPISKINCPTTADAYLASLESALATAKASIAAAPAPVTTWTPPAAQTTPPINSTLAQPSPAANVARYQSPSPAATTAPLAYNQAGPATSPAVAPTSQPQQPAIAAYTDDRYAEFYKRWNSSQPAAAQSVPGSQPTTSPPSASLVQGPTTNPQPSTPASRTWGTAGYFGQPTQSPANPTIQNPSQPIAGQPQQPVVPVQPASKKNFGFEGYCPVTMTDQNRWQEGDERWGANHRGRTYLFAGPEEQQRFLAAPDRYSPVIAGRDVVAALEHGQMLDGQRQFGIRYGGRMYLFANAANRDAFRNNTERYSAPVMQAENPNYGTTRR